MVYNIIKKICIIKKFYVLIILSVLIFSNCSDGGGWDKTIKQYIGSSSTFPTITSSSLEVDNSSIEIIFSEGVYTDPGASGALTVGDFSITFNQDTGTATDVTISGITHIAGDNTATIDLNVTGTPNGMETIEITPVDGLSIYDIDDNAMDALETTGNVNLYNTTTPTVNFSSASSSGSENITSVNIPIQLSNTTLLDVVVDYTVAAGTATGGGTDFTLANGQVIISNGTTAGNISFTVNNDTLDEDNEDFQITITNVSSANATLGGTLTHTYTINDNDATPSLSIDDVSVAENAGTAQFTVTLSAASGKSVTVNYATADGTAAAGTEYNSASNTLTFNPGITTQNFNVPIIDDTNDEEDKTFNVNLSSAVNGSITDSTGIGTITDDDDLPSLIINDVSVAEAAGNAQFTVTLSPASAKTVTVNYATADGTAAAGTEYTSTSNTLTFTPGITTQNIDVTIADDTTDEEDKTYNVNLSGAVNASITGSTGLGTITDDDLPALSIDDVSVAEAAGNAQFTVTLSPASAKTVTVNYATADGTAAAGTEYTSASNTLTFTPGITTQNISVTIADDTADEEDKTYNVNLSGAVNASITGSTGLGTITDDDAEPALSIDDVSVAEAAGNAQFTVTLSPTSAKTVTVNYATADGTAVAGTEYTSASNTLTFTPGITTQNISVTIANDTADEEDKTYNVNLSGAVNASITGSTGLGTITDDDAEPALSIDDVSVAEAAGNAQFTVTLSPASAKTVTVNYATADGTAAAGTEYTSASNTLTFTPGITTQNISVTIADDTADEEDKTYNVNLSGAVNASITGSTGLGTITDDDAEPALSIDDVSVAEAAGNAQFTVTLSPASAKTVTVNYATADGTAVDGTEYTSTSNTLTFTPGITTQNISVTIVDDTADEEDKTYNVNLSGAVNASITGSTGLGTITDDDDLPALSINDVSVAEAAGNAQFTVTLSPASAKTVTVNYATADGTAVDGTEYTSTSNTLTFTPGITTQNISVTIVDDTADEEDKTYNVNLSGAVNASITGSTGLGTITDDDDLPALSIDDVSVAEAAGNTQFTVTLSPASAKTVTVNYATADGTAAAGTEYTSASNTLTFTPGITTQNISVTIADDTADEEDKTYNVNLSVAVNASITGSTGLGTITDDDAEPSLTINNVSVAEAAGNAQFTVTLSPASAKTVTVNYATADGTAAAGTEYTSASNTLTFTPGITTQNISVTIADDTADEEDKTYNVNLSGAVNASITGSTGLGTITDDDAEPALSIDDVSVAEAAGNAQFTVTLSPSSAKTVTVNYATADGTAAAGTEYTSASNTLTFTPGITTQNISVTIADDTADEEDKTYNVNLSGAVNASITGSTGLGTITDDDAEPSLTINDVSVVEAAGNAQFTVTLSPASAKTVTVNYATADGTAVDGTEYTSASNTLTFTPGITTQNISVTIVDDTADEEDKTYNVNLSGAVNASITGSTGLGTITDDDAEPSLTINDVSVAEAAGNAQFTVTLSPASAKTVTVNYATADGTAAAGTEYTSASNTLTFTPGITTQNISVTIADDTADEEDKTYNVNLSGAVNASITGSTGLGTITDDDAEPSLTINDVSVAEAAGNAQFTVTLSPASAKTVTVNYATADGTAAAGTEYTSASNTLTFTPGITTQNISVTIADDTADEEDKTYNVNLSGAVNASITGSTGLGTITDDDAEPALSIDDVSVAEAAGNAQFTVTLSPASAKTVTVNYATADGTAIAGTEYTSASNTLTFTPGITTQNISVTIANDTADEEDKTYNVNLSGAVNASITGSTGLGTITDDDAEPSLTINDVSVVEAAGNAQFTVTLSPASAKTVTVNYATADGTAAAGTEYTSASNTLTFTPGITTQNISVTITDDTTDEEDKTYNVNLSGAVNASITSSTGLGTITDDDAEPALSIDDVSVAEAAGNAQFTVTLSPASAKTVTVNYATADGTAAAGTEYTSASNTLTFTPGITTQNISVTIADDTADEEDKTYNVNLSVAVNASITGSTGLGTITDDDAEPSLSIDDVSVAEAAGNAQFTVTLSPASAKTVTVNYATADGTAVDGTEYTSTSNTLTFTPGITTQNISVTIVDDTADEEDKTYNVNLSGAVNASITGSTGLGTITDDDDLPALSINDVSVAETAGNAQFTVTLSPASAKTVTVNYATADGTAVDGTEYTSTSNTLTFTPGITTQNISVTIVDDTADEEDKTYNVNLSGAVNASITGSTGLGTITDDDDLPALSIDDVSVAEAAGNAQFTVTLSPASAKTVTVNYATADGTAIAGTEYTSASNTLTFTPGITTQNISVTIANDTADEEDKTYNVNLSGAVNASITGSTGLGTITDDDAEPALSINDVSVAEAAGNAQFTVTLSPASAKTVTVNYATADGTAAAGTEYTSASNTLTFTPGITTQNISVTIADDTADEEDKTYNVNLSGAVNASITGSTGLGTITDDDAEPSLTINDVSVAEAAGNAQFTVTLSPASAKTVTVNYATADGTAAAGTEYTSASNTLTFTPGITTQNISVTIADDTADEEDKTYNVNLSGAVNASITGSTGLGTITDDDAEPALSIDDVSVAEAAGNAQFTVTLSPASAKTVTVNYATADGTAVAGTEYTSASNTLTFTPGITTQNIDVTIADDTTDEEDKTYNVNLSAAVNASITDSTGLGTITDDDAEPSLSIDDVSVAETAGNAQFTVTLSPASAKTVTVNYATADGTAAAGTEYTSASNTLTFTPGITTQNISVTIADDTADEEDKTYNVNLSGAVNASITGSTGLGTITDDDAEPSLTINDVSVAEAAGNAQFTVTLSPASAKTVTVNYATADGTAVAGTEYTSASNTLTFTPGITTQNIDVTIADDTTDEEDKTYNVNLSAAVNASITDSTGLGTITDDDAEPSLSIDDVSVAETAGNAQFTVTLSPASAKTVTVNYATADGTAAAGTEYTSASNTLTFTPGITTQNISVTIADDTADEEDKTYNVNLSGAVNASITGSTGLGTITDDDAEPSLTINDVSVAEAAGNAQFTVTLSPASAKTVTVNYATADGTAAAGTEYTSASNTLTFTPGITTQNISVTIADDTADEEDKTYNVNLSGAVNASITGSTGLGTITDDDAEPSLTINDVSVAEAAGNAQFTVTLSPASAKTVTVNYATSDVSTTADIDYTATSNTLTFNPGVTTQAINVSILNETKYEIDENYNIDLTAPSNATISDATGSGTITNDDSEPKVSLTIDDALIFEVTTDTSTITATLSNPSYQNITVNLLYSGTATGAGTDYISSSNSILITAGSTTETATVTAANDAIFESTTHETVIVDIDTVTNATENGTQQETIEIVDDELDTTGPTLSAVSISSDNSYDSTYARVGDNVTITIVADENIQIPTVTIDSNGATETGSQANWSASYTMQSGDTEGVLTFLISNIIDDPTGNISGDESTTTDASSVTFDETAPAQPGADDDKTFSASFNVNLTNLGEPDFSEFKYTLTGTAPADCSDGTTAQTTDDITIPTATTTLKAISCDDAGNASPLTTRVYTYSPPVTCPDGYILVPGYAVVGIPQNFCVMKYEAKCWDDAGGNDDGFVDAGEILGTGCAGLEATYQPGSHEDGEPWKSVTQSDAWDECDSLNSEGAGAGSDTNSDGTYAMISNPEWMVIARNIENVDTNWTNGTVGSGCLYRGNTGGTDACTGGSSMYIGVARENGTGRDTRASLDLDNAEVIWDFSGNQNEWIDWTLGNTLTTDMSQPNKPYDATDGNPVASYIELNLVDTFSGLAQDILLHPENSIYDSSYGTGTYFGNTSVMGGMRGGSSSTTTDSGIYSLEINLASTGSDPIVGFRCVYRPPVITSDTTNPNPPSNVTPGTVDITDNINYTPTWTNGTDTNLNHHRMMACVSSDCSTGCTKTVTPATSGSSTIPTDIPRGVSHYICVQAVDSSGNLSTWTASSNRISICPDGYIHVPGNPDAGAPGDFCVMKYEAKCWDDAGGNNDDLVDSGELLATGCIGLDATYKPGSHEDAEPWSQISQSDAWDECDSLNSEGAGAGTDTNNDGSYAMISNPEWVAIARNVENIASNWTSGIIGDRCLKRGNTGQAADTCIGGSSQYDGDARENGSGRNTLASMTLDNGEVIWDLSGNVGEWVDLTLRSTLVTDITVANMPYDATDGGPVAIVLNIDVIDIFSSMLPSIYVLPENTAFAWWHGTGRYLGNTVTSGLIRGGNSFEPDTAGIYYSNFSRVSTDNTDSNNGFRCVYRPAAITSDTTAPNPPKNVTPDAGNIIQEEADYSPIWTDGTDANLNHHRITACTASDCSTGCTKTISPARSATSNISALMTQGVSYYVCAQAVDDSGNFSTWTASPNTITIQTASFSWARRIGGVGTDEGNNIAIDSSDNIIITGFVTGDADFNENGDYLDTGEDSTDFALTDIYVAKYNSSGTFLWAKRLGGMEDDKGNGITLDDSDNIIITGFVTGDADLNGNGDFLDPGEDSTGYGLTDAFISKFDSSGAHLWSKRLGGVEDDMALNVTVDSSNDLIFTGNVTGDADLNGNGDFLDPGEDSTSYGLKDIFVSKFDSSGVSLLTIRLGGLYDDQGRGVSVDSSDNIIISGDATGDADLNNDGDFFDTGEESSGYGLNDIIITKFNSIGTHLFAIRLGGVENDRGDSINVDSSDNIIVFAQIEGEVDLNGDGDFLDNGENSTGYGDNDIAISKFNSTGTHIWAKRLGGIGPDHAPNKFAIDTSDNLILIAGVKPEADLNGDGDALDYAEGSPGVFNRTDIIITKFDSSGTHIWAKRFGGAQDDVGRGLVIDNSGNIITTGSIKTAVDFNEDGDVIDGTEDDTGYGDLDAFILKLN